MTEPNTGDPRSTADLDLVVWRSVCEPLVDHKGATNELVGVLAEKWEQVNPTTWRFTLKKGIKFQDGSTLDAQGLKDFMDWYLAPGGTGSGLILSTLVASTKVVDQYTFDFVTKQTNPTFPSNLLLRPIPSVKQVREAPASLANTISGAGPYRLKEWVRGQYITLEAWADYQGTKPAFSEVKFVFRTEPQVRASMLKTGEADVALELTPETAAETPKTETYPMPAVVQIRLNPGHPVLIDERARQALLYATDRQSIAKSIYKGFATVPSLPISEFASGFNSSLQPWPYDPAKAKQLLKDSGYDGTQLTLYARTGRYPRHLEVEEGLQGMWRDVGVNVKLEEMEAAAWTAVVRLHNKEPERFCKGCAVADMVIWDTSSELADSYEVFINNFHSTGANSVLRNQLADPELDRMIEAAGAIVDPKPRDEAFQKVWAYVYPKVYSMPIVHLQQIHGLGKRVNWKARPDKVVNAAEMRLA
ncbi:MAG: ABC transporter substrate-binding protein [Chloroflexota bacterium]